MADVPLDLLALLVGHTVALLLPLRGGHWSRDVLAVGPGLIPALLAGNLQRRMTLNNKLTKRKQKHWKTQKLKQQIAVPILFLRFLKKYFYLFCIFSNNIIY